MLNILICGGPEDREGRWTAIHCLPSRKRRGLAQLENAGRRVSPVLVGSRVEVFGRRNLASVRGDAVAFIRTGRVTPLNLVGPALGARSNPAMHEDDDSYCMTPREIAATVAFWLLLACAALFVLAWYFFASTASAHDAPTGWTYPYSCCSGQDCREVTSGPEGKVRETPQGYQIASTGEVIPYGDIRVKDSPDGAFHWCSVAGAEDTRTICLFVPPRSY